MRQTLCIFAAVVFLATLAQATPGPGNWHREVVLGVTEDAYVVWVSDWSQPGSHHIYSESVRLEVRSLGSGEPLSLHLLLSSECNKTELPPQCEVSRGSSLELVSFLGDRGFAPVFAEDPRFDIELAQDGLVVLQGERGVAILSSTQLAAQVPNLGLESRVAGSWSTQSGTRPDDGYWFFSIRSGSPAGDYQWSEVVVAVPASAVRDARRELGGH